MVNPVDVFISYSHKDEDLKDELYVHLAPLIRQGQIKPWQDRAIEAGAEWEQEIKAQLESAEIILLLITPRFLASDYCFDKEMQRAMARHDAGTARVIPVIMKSCYWQGSVFSKLQALPKDGKPVTRWDDWDEALLDVVQGMLRVIAGRQQQDDPEQKPVSVKQEAVQKPVPIAVSAVPAQPVVKEQTSTGNFTERLSNNVGLEMVKIQAGQFWMGSPGNESNRRDNEGPQHLVRVPEFWMGKYPVTQAQWAEVAALPKVEHDLEPFPSRFKGANLPIERVSWYEAVEFCQRLSRQTEHIYRLPSEAEWEYACRAGTNTRYSFGNTITGEQVNCDFQKNVVVNEGFMGLGRKEEKRGTYRGKITTVDSLPPNDWGLYDMHGNVWEWCADHWHDNYAGAPIDGAPWLSGGNSNSRVLRGGSWINYPRYCRSAARYSFTPDNRDSYYGFRVVCSAPRILH